MPRRFFAALTSALLMLSLLGPVAQAAPLPAPVAQAAGEPTLDDLRYMLDVLAEIQRYGPLSDRIKASSGDSTAAAGTLHEVAAELADIHDKLDEIPPTPRFAQEHADLVAAQGAFADALEQMAQAIDDLDPDAASAAQAALDQANADFASALERWGAKTH